MSELVGVMQLPTTAEGKDTYLLRHNTDARSEVWRVGQWVYKRQPKFLCDNEIYFYTKLWTTGYVPWAERIDLETLKIAWVARTPIADRRGWLQHIPKLLNAMRVAGVRHGDLTEYAIIPVANQPIVVDWAESRMYQDPRPDKRPEGDEYWAKKTMEELFSNQEGS